MLASLVTHRLVTIAAVGGVGKTRLALEAGGHSLASYPAGVWFVDLTEALDDEHVAAKVSKAVGLDLNTTQPFAELADFIAPQSMLVILDNCEHVIDACVDLASRLLATPGEARLLATSREWLDIDGEQVHQLPGLALDESDSPAVELFVARAQAADSAFVATTDELQVIQEICGRLDGLPLAIELAAARAPVFGLEGLLGGLDDRFALLSGGRRRQRTRTLEATIDWSYDLLEPDEQQFFASLGVFVGGFTLDAAAHVGDVSRAEAADLVEDLMARSLVARVGAGRFRLLETLKAYAEDRLVDLGIAAEVRDRHLEFCRSVFPNDHPADFNLSDLSRTAIETANGLSAGDWAEANGRWEDAADLYVGMADAFLVCGDSVGTLARLARCQARISDPLKRVIMDWSRRYHQMLIADWPGWLDSTRRMIESDDPMIAAAGHCSSALTLSRHDPERALARIDRASAALRAAGLPDTCEVYGQRAWVLLQQGDAEAARRCAAEGLSDPDRYGMGTFMRLGLDWTLACCAWLEGDYTAARRHATENVDIDHVFANETLAKSTVAFWSALAELGLGSVETASSAIADFARTAATGRMALEANDAVALVAILCLAEGDTERARELVFATGSPRSPYSTGVAQEVARRLGEADALEQTYRDHIGDPDWLVELPKRTLAEEITRRGW